MGHGSSLACAAAAYGLGCFPSGWVLVRGTTGRDVRTVGSGSTGARNVGRVLGTPGFLATTVLDIFKGALAVGIARGAGAPSAVAGAAALAVVAGHVWPAPLGFRGGKGVATAFGALLALDLATAGIVLASFPVVYAAFRRSAPAAMASFAVAPAAAWALGHGAGTAAALAAVAGVVVFAHRENLRTAAGPGASNGSEVRDGS